MSDTENQFKSASGRGCVKTREAQASTKKRPFRSLYMRFLDSGNDGKTPGFHVLTSFHTA
jgi:hypothetical protein